VVVEELLKTFVSVVDAQLFEGVEVEDFETSNIKKTDEVIPWKISGQSSVDDNQEPVEKTTEDTLGEGTESI
jgi:hypothetical protein